MLGIKYATANNQLWQWTVQRRTSGFVHAAGGYSQAADAILLKDHEERRRVLTARANSAYKKAPQLMILESQTMSSAQVQRNLAHLEALLRRLGEAVTAKSRFVPSKEPHCAVCQGTEREKR
jgi:hypothetical protein